MAEEDEYDQIFDFDQEALLELESKVIKLELAHSQLVRQPSAHQFNQSQGYYTNQQNNDGQQPQQYHETHYNIDQQYPAGSHHEMQQQYHNQHIQELEALRQERDKWHTDILAREGEVSIVRQKLHRAENENATLRQEIQRVNERYNEEIKRKEAEYRRELEKMESRLMFENVNRQQVNSRSPSTTRRKRVKFEESGFMEGFACEGLPERRNLKKQQTKKEQDTPESRLLVRLKHLPEKREPFDVQCLLKLLEDTQNLETIRNIVSDIFSEYHIQFISKTIDTQQFSVPVIKSLVRKLYEVAVLYDYCNEEDEQRSVCLLILDLARFIRKHLSIQDEYKSISVQEDGYTIPLSAMLDQLQMSIK